MFAETNWLAVTINSGVADVRKDISGGSRKLVGPDLEAFERMGQKVWRIATSGRIAASRHQDAAHARHIVARIEGVPAAADPGFEPGCEIAR